ncbi:MAG: hypothetical protein ACRDLP_12970 [Solirubrobacteraceae bacterium]
MALRAVRDSGIAWTLLRPPRFVGGGPLSSVRVFGEGEPGRVGHVVGADLAGFLMQCASEGRYAGQAVAVGS